MATKIAPAEPPAPAHIEPTKAHRAFARSRGQDADVLLSLLHSALRDAALIAREVLSSVPDTDPNRSLFELKVALIERELQQLGP